MWMQCWQEWLPGKHHSPIHEFHKFGFFRPQHLQQRFNKGPHYCGSSNMECTILVDGWYMPESIAALCQKFW